MSSDLELCLIQLKESLQQAALPADQQIERLTGFDIPFEVADDVGNWCLWALRCDRLELNNDQRFALESLNDLLDAMSGEKNKLLWTTDALRSRPEWAEVSRKAQIALQAFQWPVDEPPPVQVVRCRESG
jgi:hypothetical protein